jgi:phage gp46-like protein
MGEAARRRWIDPQTGDYERDRGGLRDDDGAASRVVFLLRLRRGTCAVSPQLGNPIYDDLDVLDEQAEARAERSCRTALLPLTRSRFIRDLTVDATIGQGGTVLVVVGYVDQSGVERTTRVTLSPGGP